MDKPSNGGAFPEKASGVCITATLWRSGSLLLRSRGNPSTLKTAVAPFLSPFRRLEFYAEYSDSFCR